LAGGLLLGEDWIEGGDSALDSDSASDSVSDSASASLFIAVSINDIYTIKGYTYLQLLVDLVPFELFYAL
jgi:hypothetical protein